MKHTIKFILLLAVLALLGLKAQAKSLELPAIDVVPIKDSTTDRQYELYIKLPKSYKADGDKNYPVLYIADALWHIEIISGSAEYVLSDTILVGISWEKGIPPQQSRMRDYTPIKYQGDNYQHPTGEAKQHLEFINNQVFNYIETNYKADPTNRSIYGYSASGSFASYILLTKPETFKNYLIGSPAPLFHDNFIYEYQPIISKTPATFNANVFISVGADEQQDYIQHALGLTQFVKSKVSKNKVRKNKISKDNEVKFTIIESADHSKAFPMSALKAIYWLAEIEQ